ncbi:MAG: OprO/OprP family phosphate-selective porin [Bacteroidales bacterium]|nr:OprO/OprP family phosphate-selective porin [Bacteroidales bacterium]
MKKLSSLLFAVLVSTMMFGQVSMDFNVIGRVDANPRFTFDGEKPTYNWANSSVYTQLETSFGEKFSLTLINHWAASDELEPRFPFAATPGLYTNIWKANAATFVDYLYFEYRPTDSFSLRLGKDCLAIGGFEYDEWDWNVDYDLASTFWNWTQAYQWGASIAWTNGSENTEFRLQAVSSQGYIFESDFDYVQRPWQRGLGAYFFQHTGEYGILETRNHVGFMMTEKNSGYLNAGVGLRFNVMDGLSVGADFLDLYEIKLHNNYLHALATAKYEPTEKWEILGKFGYEHYLFDGEKDYRVFGGVSAAYFPLRDKKDLRVMATLAGTRGLPGISLTVGVTYNLPIHIL